MATGATNGCVDSAAGRDGGTSGVVGRCSELEAVAHSLRQGAGGAGGGLVITGEAGAGKSLLLDWAADEAARQEPTVEVVRVRGVKSESELDYAALDRILRVLGPCGQQPGTGTAARRRGTDDPSALSPASLLEAVADPLRTSPLLLLLDDADLIDAPTLDALAYLVRRSDRLAITVVVACRVQPEAWTEDFTVIEIGGLAESDAAALFTSTSKRRLDTRYVELAVHLSAGNPAVLCGLAHGAETSKMRADQLLFAGPPLSPTVTQPWLSEVSRLTDDAQLWLLVAACEWTGQLRAIASAAATLGLAPDASADAEDAGLVALSGSVAFSHRAVATSVVSASSPSTRRKVHLALASYFESEHSSVRADWHLAAGTVAPNDGVASRLAGAASRFDDGMTYLCRAALLARSGELSSDPGLGAERLALAAEHATVAGATIMASELASAALFAAPAQPSSVVASERVPSLSAWRPRPKPDPIGALARGGATSDALLRAIDTWKDAPLDAAAPQMRASLGALLSGNELDDDTAISAYPLGVLLATALWDVEAVHGLVASARDAAQRRQAHGVGGALDDLAWTMALSVGGPGRTDRRPEFEAVQLYTGPGRLCPFNPWRAQAALLQHMVGSDHRRVLADLDLIDRDSFERRSGQILAEEVEVAALTGEAERASKALAELERITAHVPTPWALGVVARCRALAADGDVEEHFQESIVHLSSSSASTQLARTQLVFGEWLRRQRRRGEAARYLSEASDHLGSMSHPLAERCLRELSLTGVGPSARNGASSVVLTSQELAVARLAQAGARNKQIAEKLYISRHTVDFHLRKVYQKLGIEGRHDISSSLAAR